MTNETIIEVDVGFARVEFLSTRARGRGVAALLAAGGAGLVDTDTSGRRVAFVVPESVAADAGLLAKPKRRAPRRKAKPAPAPETVDAAPSADNVAGDGLDLSDSTPGSAPGTE